MPIDLPDLEDVPTDRVLALEAEGLAALSVDRPDLDLQAGKVQDLVIFPNGIFSARLEAAVDRYQAVRSLEEINANPTLADPAAVDAIASNFLAIRSPAGAADGSVTIVVDDDVTVAIAIGSIYEAAGRLYAATTAIVAKADVAQVDDVQDRLLRPAGTGRWAFEVPVVAQEVGTVGAARAGTSFTPQSPPPGFATAYAAGDFSGGADAETNAALVQRLREGIPARTVSNRATMRSFLRTQSAFRNTVRSSIVGCGDPEAVRARQGLLGLPGGGRVDWYLRSGPRAVAVPLTVAATCTATVGGTATWQASFGRDDAPGFYEIRRVRRAGQEATFGLEVSEILRGLDVADYDGAPAFADASQGAFSRFQTATVRWLEPQSPAVAGDRADFDLDAVAMPQIADAQDLVSGRETRFVAADCAVYGPVPCFVQVSFSVERSSGTPVPDLDAIRRGVADAVSATGFVGAVFASQVHAAVRTALEGTGTPGRIGLLDLFGRLLRPDGTTHYPRDPERLAIPNEPERRVAARTVQFFCDPEDVAVADAPGLPGEEG